MALSNIAVARQVAQRLLAAEEAIDAALRETAQLAHYMPIARQEASVSVAVGQKAIEEAIATLSSLGEARRKIILTHQALAGTQERIGLRERNYGGFVDKPRHRAELEVVQPLAQAG
jgi:hypothetical protein